MQELKRRTFCAIGRIANARMLERKEIGGWPIPKGWGRLYCPVCGGGTPDTGCRMVRKTQENSLCKE
jgi:hypothetical protein